MKSVMRNLFKTSVGRQLRCPMPNCGKVLDCRTAIEISEPGHMTVTCLDHWTEEDVAHFRKVAEVVTWEDVK